MSDKTSLTFESGLHRRSVALISGDRAGISLQNPISQETIDTYNGLMSVDIMAEFSFYDQKGVLFVTEHECSKEVYVGSSVVESEGGRAYIAEPIQLGILPANSRSKRDGKDLIVERTLTLDGRDVVVRFNQSTGSTTIMHGSFTELEFQSGDSEAESIKAVQTIKKLEKEIRRRPSKIRRFMGVVSLAGSLTTTPHGVADQVIDRVDTPSDKIEALVTDYTEFDEFGNGPHPMSEETEDAQANYQERERIESPENRRITYQGVQDRLTTVIDALDENDANKLLKLADDYIANRESRGGYTDDAVNQLLENVENSKTQAEVIEASMIFLITMG